MVRNLYTNQWLVGDFNNARLSAQLFPGTAINNWQAMPGFSALWPLGNFRSWHKAAPIPCYRFSYQPQHPEKLSIIARHFPVSSTQHFPLLPIFLLSGLNLSIHNVVYKIHGTSSWKFFRQWFSGVGSKTYGTGELKRSLPHAFFVWLMVYLVM